MLVHWPLPSCPGLHGMAVVIAPVAAGAFEGLQVLDLGFGAVVTTFRSTDGDNQSMTDFQVVDKLVRLELFWFPGSEII